MNRRVQKATPNYDLAEYAPIMKLQDNQTEVIKKVKEPKREPLKTKQKC